MKTHLLLLHKLCKQCPNRNCGAVPVPPAPADPAQPGAGSAGLGHTETLPAASEQCWTHTPPFSTPSSCSFHCHLQQKIQEHLS